jgi:hypothetical protein
MIIGRISSDKDSHFTTELAQHAMETENIDMPGDWGTIGVDKSLIIGVVLQAKANLEYDVAFWPTDAHDNTDLDLDKALGYVNFFVSDGKQVAGANQFRYPSERLSIPYIDEDKSSEFHVGLINRSTTTKAASDTVTITIFAVPHI